MSSQYKLMQIRLASPEEIENWSYGEVKKHETINYRTLKPETDGLFCERIFGPTKDYQCACGKSKRNVDKGKVCDKCGVEITEAKVRRERMGHIKLASPVVHTWYLKNSPSRLAVLLDIKAKDLEEVVYLASYIVTDPGNVEDLSRKQILSEGEFSQLHEQHGKKFKALTGAEAVKALLMEIDLEKEVKELRRKLKTASKQKRDRIIKRLEVVESFNNSDNRPEWMVLEVLPVIPPELRPMVQLDGGRFATTDLNDLYRRILNRNNRLKRQYEQNAPHLITKNEKRMLQEAVDALIDNSKRGKKAVVEKNRHLKSLSDMLRGKQGRFRQNLLGKRVDYSGRSVIVVGPDLEMYQCGIPKEMALTLFKPYVIRELIANERTSISNAKRKIEKLDDSVWPILESVIHEHPVLLNRAPTLHRLGIQAFEPKLIEGKAIRLHPLVTTAFNADFDGDQMAVHIPLSNEAQAEARLLMLASNNILNPKDGKPVVTPSHDMVLGNYYLTTETLGQPNEGHAYLSYEEAYLAYANKEITLHTRILVMPESLGKTCFTEEQNKSLLITTLGKIIFNQILPKSFPYLNEPTEDNLVKEIPNKYFIKRGIDPKTIFAEMPKVEPFKKKYLGRIIAEVFKQLKITETSKMLDKLKDLGFKYSTIAGITISAADVQVYSKKDDLIKETEEKIDKITELHDSGFVTDKERKQLVTKEWAIVKDKIQKGLMEELKTDNHMAMMADSGARGNANNFTQLAGMRGLMNNPKGDVIEVPVKASFREGLTVSEFFISTHGARKGSTDTALKTAESGYLTRRLVDVSQDAIVTENDCGTDRGMKVESIYEGGVPIVDLYDRIIGRYASKPVIDSKTGEMYVNKNELITNEIGEQIINAGIETLFLRTNLTCNSKTGVCTKCYGRNLATNNIVEVGEAVGIIAAQSIGEPGTQLTMRTFQTGGVASASDITQGLPRVQELFEARNPKGKAIISEINGRVRSIEKLKHNFLITVENDQEERKYTVEANAEILVKKGEKIIPGQKITVGNIAPKELLRATNSEEVQKYILKEIQKVYRAQGVEISDKHIELIIRQMMRKIMVIIEGDTTLLPGMETSIHHFAAENKRMLSVGGKLAIGKPLLLGITRASLRSDSFLSAASFQETTRVLTDAAIKGKTDELLGLKENVIIGGLIPAGTGILADTFFDFTRDMPDEEMIGSSSNPYLQKNSQKVEAFEGDYEDDFEDEDK
ncbi:MAG: DNA-directed RNA polymerase subunit beta' [Erysipelotrichales bacterium]|nr:DNA-directed RNA polymerase subunit beta' [Erysipelotrichales bacterium]